MLLAPLLSSPFYEQETLQTVHVAAGEVDQRPGACTRGAFSLRLRLQGVGTVGVRVWDSDLDWGLAWPENSGLVGVCRTGMARTRQLQPRKK